MLRIPGKLWIFVFFLTSSLLFAQEPRAVRPNYKQAELFNPDYLRQRIYSTSVSPQWIGETDHFWYSYKTSQGTHYSIVDPAKRKKEPLFDHQDLASKLSVELRKPVDEFALSFSNPEVDDKGATFSFVLEKTSFELDLKTGVLTNKGEPKESARDRSREEMQRQFRRRRQSTEEEEDEEKEKDPRAHRNFSPDRTAYVFLQDYNLYYVEASDEVKKEIKAIEERLKKEKEEKKKAKAEGKTEEKVEGEEKKEEKELKEKTDVEDEKVVEEKKEEEKRDVEEQKDTEEKKDDDVEKKEVDEKKQEEKDDVVEEKKDDDLKKDDEEKEDDDKEDDGKKKGDDDDKEKKEEEDEVDERERWADDVDESKALQLTDDCEEKYEFSGGGRFSRRGSEFGEEDANQYGWDENDLVERARLLGQDDEEKKKEEEKKKTDDQKEEKKEDVDKKDEDKVEKKKGEEEKEDATEEKDEPKKTRPNVSWAPDSTAFHATRRDSRDVAELFLVNSLAEPRPTLEKYSYPMPGEENVYKSELFLFDRTRKELFRVPPVWKDEGYTNVHWGKLPEREPIEKDEDEEEEDEKSSKDEPEDKWKVTGAELRFIRRDRLLRNIQLVSTNVRTGEAKTLIEDGFEKGNVEYESVRYLEDRKNEMLWWSERTGWGHYYLYQWDGTLKNAVTSGAFRASRIMEIDEEKGLLYFRGNAREEGENVYYEHLYRIYLDGTDLSIMDPGNATHRSTLSPTNNYLVDNHSCVDLAPRSVLRDADGAEIMKLEESDLSRLYEAGWKMPETFSVKAADGVTDLFGNMWKPFDFNPKKRYPIIAEVYPGPQTEGVSSSFSASNSRQQLAQVGFIVVQLGHRGGTPARSKAYHIHGYFDLRDYGLADKKAGLEQLAARHPYIDIERVGIYGHSGGGFMTAAALLRKPYNEFFKVGIASAGNHDNNIYNQRWGERYHGLKRVEVEVKKEDEKKGRRSKDGKKKKDDDTEKEDVEKKDDDTDKDDVEKKDDDTDKDDVEEKVDLLEKNDDVEKKDDDLKKDGDQKEEDGDKKKKEKEKETEIRFEIEVPTNAELAENLKGHLLLVHGEIDNNVHPAGTIRLADALIKANKRFDMMILPGQRHGFGAYTGYFNRMRWEYFAEHLLGDYQAGADINYRE